MTRRITIINLCEKPITARKTIESFKATAGNLDYQIMSVRKDNSTTYGGLFTNRHAQAAAPSLKTFIFLDGSVDKLTTSMCDTIKACNTPLVFVAIKTKKQTLRVSNGSFKSEIANLALLQETSSFLLYVSENDYSHPNRGRETKDWDKFIETVLDEKSNDTNSSATVETVLDEKSNDTNSSATVETACACIVQ